MNKIKLLLLIFPFLLAASCTEEEELTNPEEFTIYFQFEYVNHAWTYQHQGFIIDQHGNSYDYHQPENWIWPENNQISLEDFENNLSQTESRLDLLDGSDIKRMELLALRARQGKLTEGKSVMADAGAEIYAIYLAKKDSPSLTRYLLQQRGDWYQKNTSSASDEIVEWLIGIRGEAGYTEEHF
ncbi:hypothetical protein [Sunxiuqinia sp. sy24]|uniref:hypothetical protein n=1 Tax=Sunxiuqinia sp. sy24 TaxID=3461495 RepID=UPI004046508F